MYDLIGLIIIYCHQLQLMLQKHYPSYMIVHIDIDVHVCDRSASTIRDYQVALTQITAD